MDMLTDAQIADADLTDWRKLGQGLHARYLVGDFAAGARFVTAISAAGDACGAPPARDAGQGVRRPEADQRRRHLPRQGGRRARRGVGDAARRGPRATDHGHRDRARRRGRPHRGRDRRARARHSRRRADRPGVGCVADRNHRVTRPRHAATTSATPPGGCRSCGSRTPTSTRRPASASTSTSGSRPSTPSSASPRPSPPAGSSSTTAKPRRTRPRRADGNKACVCTALPRAED